MGSKLNKSIPDQNADVGDSSELSDGGAADAAWGVYLLECADGTYYCGVTNDIDKRVAAHNSGKGARYTRCRLPVSLLVYSGNQFSRSEALKMEYRVKRLPKKRKAQFIRSLCF